MCMPGFISGLHFWGATAHGTTLRLGILLDAQDRVRPPRERLSTDSVGIMGGMQGQNRHSAVKSPVYHHMYPRGREELRCGDVGALSVQVVALTSLG